MLIWWYYYHEIWHEMSFHICTAQIYMMISFVICTAKLSIEKKLCSVSFSMIIKWYLGVDTFDLKLMTSKTIICAWKPPCKIQIPLHDIVDSLAFQNLPCYWKNITNYHYSIFSWTVPFEEMDSKCLHRLKKTFCKSFLRILHKLFL